MNFFLVNAFQHAEIQRLDTYNVRKTLPWLGMEASHRRCGPLVKGRLACKYW
jgi:hypothetical protein